MYGTVAIQANIMHLASQKEHITMKIIGITGGVGAGKSQVLDYLEEKYHACILKADQLANDLKLPGQICYQRLVDHFGTGILDAEGYIDKGKFAMLIFGDETALQFVNRVVHPAVKESILSQLEEEKKKGVVSYFFIEAALLIENKYDEICDELWYIYADEKVRRERLKESRGYSEEKIQQIYDSQLNEAEFRKHCQVVIDNGGSLEQTYAQIDEQLEDK